VANTLKVIRKRAVGFIDWLDGLYRYSFGAIEKHRSPQRFKLVMRVFRRANLAWRVLARQPVPKSERSKRC
jgi:hypothetical protein